MQVKNKGFTMMEMLIVVVIVGILATLSIGYYTAAKENVADSEAKSNLKNIQVAEKSYNLDHNTYYPEPPAVSEAGIGNINANLKLSLPSVGNINWNYTVFSTGNTFCAQATRNGGNGRSWFINSPAIGTEPTPGTCP